MVADPAATPVICGGVTGEVAPLGTRIVLGEMARTLVSLLVNVRVTPGGGAGGVMPMESAELCPGASKSPPGKVIVEEAATVIVSFTVGIP
jgi:hypothetical protein